MPNKIEVGLEVLISDGISRFKGKRVGLLTHPAAVTENLLDAASALQMAGIGLSALFSPEHGIASVEADGKSVGDSIDQRLGLPIYSLYGETREPTSAMLANIDTLIIDLQDVGIRFYTYISTLYYCLRAAGKTGIEVVVLDRPNPLGGVKVEGPVITPELLSFVGISQVPIRHGLTIAEVAMWMNGESHLKANLSVIKMKGWQRAMDYYHTGRAWVPTSPAIPHLTTLFCYPGTCLFEGTNLTEGRGTPLPFEYVGAPWLDGYKLAQDLNDLKMDGVRFRPAMFIPANDKHQGKVCCGVQVHVINRDVFQPVRAGLEMVAACQKLAPREFEFLLISWEAPYPHFDLLAGNSRLREGIQAGAPIQDLVKDSHKQEEDFLLRRSSYLLYD
jgi:uncharacterized protein YbbC (DUF1343 family)